MKIDEAVGPAIKAVARRGPYFTKREVVIEVLRRRGLRELVVELRRAYVGQELDLVVLRYVEIVVTRGLQIRDEHRVRVYECYSVGNGERRWQPLRSMNGEDLKRVVVDLRALREQVDAKLHVYEALLAELERKPKVASVDEIYIDTLRRLKLR